MQKFRMVVCGVSIALVCAVALEAQNRAPRVSALLTGLEEVPAVATAAGGTFNAHIDDATLAVDYTLSYSGLEAQVTQAHIHFAQPNVNGGIMVWLCGTATNPGPAGTPTCPQSGTVTGTLRPADVQTVGAGGSQGILPGDFDRFIAAVRGGYAYVNVHTLRSPAGEIRGQVRPGNR